MASEVNVLASLVKVEGGVYGGHRRFHGYSTPYIAAGYSISISAEMHIVELGGPGMESVGWWSFVSADEAKAEFERLKALLFAREWVEWVTMTLAVAGIVPESFHGAILAGELESLLVAADWQEEVNNLSAAMLLRSAYYRIRGEANIAVSAGKGFTIVYNPHTITKRSLAKPGIGACRAVVVEAGKSVRIVSLRTQHEPADIGGKYTSVVTTDVQERIFRIGDQAEYDSYNLVYFGPVKSISAKMVVIDRSGFRTMGGTSRLALAKFVEKNHDFDLARAQKRNNEWMD